MRNFFLLFLLAAVFLLSGALGTVHKETPLVSYVPPARLIDALSGTFRVFLSDVFFLKAVQLIGDEHAFYSRFDDILKTLRIAQRLDYEFRAVNLLGGMIISKNEAETRQSIAFLEQARIHNPDEWRLAYWIGVNYAYVLEDFDSAIEYFQIASRLPQAPLFLVSNQPMFYYKAGKARLGVHFLREYERSFAKEGKTSTWLQGKIRWLSHIVYLEEKVEEFRRKTGSFPDSLDELIAEGIITEIPPDPFGGGYFWHAASRRVQSYFESNRYTNKHPDTDTSCPNCSSD